MCAPNCALTSQESQVAAVIVVTGCLLPGSCQHIARGQLVQTDVCGRVLQHAVNSTYMVKNLLTRSLLGTSIRTSVAGKEGIKTWSAIGCCFSWAQLQIVNLTLAKHYLMLLRSFVECFHWKWMVIAGKWTDHFPKLCVRSNVIGHNSCD